ncbi:NlpC/P60 family protein [Antribacter sp. KLBMP9083]|uniref:NlpC/P60 family protein n=1 Tax=Antribacter soli TaxID=2910976 RepID=A0AA41U798_9MICO|nr:C40 family peptidase [Antribacter soli]MCF4121125.1 NlpC/P60 family protein [Antribacter soli]
MTRTGRSRHRAVRRPGQEALAVARTVAQGLEGSTRRGAIMVAASGVLLSALASPAGAETTTANTPQRLSTVDLDALTSAARESLRSAPVVTVAPDAKLVVEQATVSVTPAPEPAPAAQRTSTTSRTTVRDVPAFASGSAVVSIAARYLGVPYLWGGSSPEGFDCSGFTSYVYAQVGIDLPRTSSEQRYAGTVISRSEAQPGDLIWSPGHIAIYAGDGMQIEAPVPGSTVKYSRIWQSSPTFIRVG